MRIAAAFAIGAALGLCGCARAQGAPAPLVLERTIALPEVAGRIDHVAIDPAGRTLIVAEIGNNSVDVVDLRKNAVSRRISNLPGPQGVAFDQTGRFFVVAERGDGALRVFDAASFAQVAAIPVGADADDVRVDSRNGHAIVGYGGGGLAVFDFDTRAVVSRVPLPAHPEGFQVDPITGAVFVNLPDAGTVAVVDIDHSKILARWKLPNDLWNYPMALDETSTGLAIVFRVPARLALFNRSDGLLTASVSTCGDADDVYFDAHRRRIYVSCGAGAVDVFDASRPGLPRLARVKTPPGARTALFAPALDRLFVASRAPSGSRDASILVYRPEP